MSETTLDPEQDEEEVSAFGIPKRFGKTPGAGPGLDASDLRALPTEAGSVAVTCIDYSADQFEVTEVTDVNAFLEEHRPEWSHVRWINVDGLTDLRILEGIAAKYNLHPLAIEDVLHVPQRPKCENYPEKEHYQARLFVIARLVRYANDRLETEQISFFLGHKTVLTFQEDKGDVFDPIRARITKTGSRIRGGDASFLVYSLLDAITDHCFPLVERIGDRLEDLEVEILENPTPAIIQEVHRTKRDLLVLRHAVWPMREVIGTLQREPHECMSDLTRTYLRDVGDHVVQIIDIVEAYREIATALNDTYMTAMSHRMNEIMKVLTIVGTVFIPITFLAGVYGMNFRHMPELELTWTYPSFWILCLAASGGMLYWLRTRGWL